MTGQQPKTIRLATATAAALATGALLVLTTTALKRRRRRQKQRPAASATKAAQARAVELAVPTVALCFSADYAAASALEALKSCGLAVARDASSALAQWGDFALLDWDRLLQGKSNCRLSSFYVRSGLVRKATLAHYLRKRGLLEGVLPETIVADIEDQEDLEALRRNLAGRAPTVSENKCPAWVVKASTANRGEHLYLAGTAEEAIEALGPIALGTPGISEWVVQRYVPPLLLDGRKFHIRAHLLVTGCPRCGHIRALLHQEAAVLLLANERYSPDPANRRAHLTNHCVQVEVDEYDEASCIQPLSALDHLASIPGLTLRTIAGMERCAAAALTAAASAPATFAPVPQCFELYGVDFVLDGGPEPGVWLLELNAGPDMSVFGDKLRPSCVQLLRDVLRVAVLPHLDTESQTYVKNCNCQSLAEGTGFGTCLWELPSRSNSADEDLRKFRRRTELAAGWAKAMHEQSELTVRGMQGAAMDSVR